MPINQVLKNMVSRFPCSPGVYLFKNERHVPIYIGKATSLRERVNSYFQQKMGHPDVKLQAMLDEAGVVEYISTQTAQEAALLEAKLIGRHKPKFNVALRHGQPFLYLFFTEPITRKDKLVLPRLLIVRNKEQEGRYIGPFFEKQKVRSAHRYLLNTFALNICNKQIVHGCLDYHLGTCPGTCKSNFNAEDYCFRFELAYQAIKHDRVHFIRSIEEKIKEHSAQLAFEKAKHVQEYLRDIDAIFAMLSMHFFKNSSVLDTLTAAPSVELPIDNMHDGRSTLHEMLGMPQPIRIIDCFDISHFQSHEIVGSCIRFVDGKPCSEKFRRFRVKTLAQQNDYAALQEIIARRYKTKNDVPDLVLIDGGKGQLSAARAVLSDIPCVALAKKEERLYASNHPEGLVLSPHQHESKILLALRDYAHHFAISYHRLRRRKRATKAYAGELATDSPL